MYLASFVAVILQCQSVYPVLMESVVWGVEIAVVCKLWGM
jgi:hypothetical protein